ncbi:MAG: MipA/OmpV family protein [Gallionella sp.]
MKFLSTVLPALLGAMGVLCSATVSAADALPNRIQGDIGVAVYANTNPVNGVGGTQIAVPYSYFDYGRFFARFDTFGIKTLPLGYGYLEVVGRVNLDGFRTNNPALRGIRDRQNSLPLGMGTFQETPFGGFFLNAFYDVNRSHGQLYELIYAAKFDVGNAVVYPMFGFEHFTAQYTQYFYGVSPTEAQNSLYPTYIPKANTTTMLGWAWEIPVEKDWNINVYMMRRWLGSAITQSPLVNSRTQDEAFFAFSYHYK